MKCFFNKFWSFSVLQSLNYILDIVLSIYYRNVNLNNAIKVHTITL